MCPIIKVCDTQSRVQCYECSMLMPEGFCCDKCLEEELRILVNLGIKTTGSCCGNHVNSRCSGYIGVTDEFISIMKKLGYKVAYNSSRPGDEDEFVPKTIFQKENK